MKEWICEEKKKLDDALKIEWIAMSRKCKREIKRQKEVRPEKVKEQEWELEAKGMYVPLDVRWLARPS